MESTDRQDRWEQQAYLVQLDLLVQLVSLVQSVLMEPMDCLDFPETQDPPDLSVTLEMVVSLVSQDQLGESVQEVRLDSLE